MLLKTASLQDSFELTHEERMTYFIPELLLDISSVHSLKRRMKQTRIFFAEAKRSS